MARTRWICAFTLAAAVPLLASCLCPLTPFLPEIGSAPTTGELRVEIDYTGTWYRETFDYARDAENIRHFVLVIPESESGRVDDPGWIFTSLVPSMDSITIRDDRQEYAWGLDYLYEAPEGHFTGLFEPGTYAVAASFIAAPLSREEAGVGEDAILWAGVTGGGASTLFQTVTLEAGETTSLAFAITDDDGWACPWLYVFDGEGFQRRTEILRNLRGPDRAATEITPLGPVTVVDGAIVLRVAEERDEIAFIDELTLLIDGEPVRAEGDPALGGPLAAADGDVLALHRGETVDLRFPVPDSFIEGDPVSVVVTGHYLPVE